MPIDYSRGKIYKIVGNGKVYVGSTARALSTRKAEHSCEFRKWKDGKRHYVSSFECLSDPDCYIEVLEMCPCSCVDELRKCERKWIEETDCVNKKVTGRNHIEYQHSEQGKEKAKIAYEAKKDEFVIKKKAYYETNNETILEKKRAYYQANRDKILQKQNERDKKKKAEKSIPHLGNSIEL